MSNDMQGRPLRDLFTDLKQETRTLIHQEMDLMRVEMSAKMVQMAKDSAALVVGGVLLYSGFLVLLAAIVLGVAEFIPAWLSALLVSGLCLAIGIALLVKGGKDLAKLKIAPKKTEQSLKETAQWVKTELKPHQAQPDLKPHAAHRQGIVQQFREGVEQTAAEVKEAAEHTDPIEHFRQHGGKGLVMTSEAIKRGAVPATALIGAGAAWLLVRKLARRRAGSTVAQPTEAEGITQSAAKKLKGKPAMTAQQALSLARVAMTVGSFLSTLLAKPREAGGGGRRRGAV